MPRHHTMHDSPAAMEREFVELWRKVDQIEQDVQPPEAPPPQVPPPPPPPVVSGGGLKYWSFALNHVDDTPGNLGTASWPVATIAGPAYTHLRMYVRVFDPGLSDVQLAAVGPLTLRWQLTGSVQFTTVLPVDPHAILGQYNGGEQTPHYEWNYLVRGAHMIPEATGPEPIDDALFAPLESPRGAYRKNVYGKADDNRASLKPSPLYPRNLFPPGSAADVLSLRLRTQNVRQQLALVGVTQLRLWMWFVGVYIEHPLFRFGG